MERGVTYILFNSFSNDTVEAKLKLGLHGEHLVGKSEKGTEYRIKPNRIDHPNTNWSLIGTA